MEVSYLLLSDEDAGVNYRQKERGIFLNRF